MGVFDALVGGAIDAFTQHSANKANKKLAGNQMEFQERMSSTEMQRRVADLRAAGLNPMLAGINQQGASSAQGAMARVDPITRNTASTALAVAAQRAQLENMKAQTDLLVQQKENTRQDTFLKGASAGQVNALWQKTEHETMALAQDIKRKMNEVSISAEQLSQQRLTTEQMRKLQPLAIEYQALVNQAQRLGMDQRKVDSDFAKSLGEDARIIQFIKMILGK